MREETGRGTAEEQEVDGLRHRPQVNQRRDEPVPGSSHHSGTQPPDETDPADTAGKDRAATDEQRSAASAQDEAAEPSDEAAGPGKAVRDMMGGPPPQGDVPDAPATQIAATDEEREGTSVAFVANAVPGKPDGEVDTRGGYTGT
jgi:hypothetical protein